MVGLAGPLILSLVLGSPILYKIFQLFLVYWRASWRNKEGTRMPGELPMLPFGHFCEVNFFGRRFSEKHGPIYYLWHGMTPVVVLSDACAIRTFYADHYSHHRDRDLTCLGPVFKDILGRCMATSHGRKDIRRCRGPFEKYFSSAAVKDTLGEIWRECEVFKKSLPVGKPVDLLEKNLASVTFKVLVCVVYGKHVLEEYYERFEELSKLLDDALKLINSSEARLPFVAHFPCSKVERTVNAFITAWESFNKFLFNGYEEGRLDSGDSLFYETMKQVKSSALDIDKEELLHSLDEILLLNIDVSFTATSFALADLAQYPDLQEKVRQEVDEVLHGQPPSMFPDLEKNLPYLEMFLKESARMHPAIALSLPERTVKPVTDLCGYQVPKGTPICVDSYSLNYSENYWTNPYQFDPERFANGVRQVQSSFFRFGMGPRKCLGYRYALAITRIAVISFLQEYTLTLTDEGSATRLKVDGITFFTPYLCPKLILHKRSTCPESH